MKLLKYFLLSIGILGVIASIYNTVHMGTLYGQKIEFILSIFLIYTSFRIEKWYNEALIK